MEDITINPDDLYRKITESGLDYAKKKLASDLADGRLKPLLASLTIQAKETLNCSVSEAEKHALSSNAYKDAHTAACNASHETLEARVVYDAQNTYVDLARTQAATDRAANRLAT